MIQMDNGLEGAPLRIVETGETLTVTTSTADYRYRRITNPNHSCEAGRPLKVGDTVVVQRVVPNGDILVKGPCGCNYLLWDLVSVPPHNVGNLLDRVREWMILRFALNTDQDPWVWLFVIGASAHLEYLAVAVLWVAEGKPAPFEQYSKRTLGQAAYEIREKGLLDLATVDTLKRISELRNSVAHRGATYGVPFRDGEPSRGQYKGRHVFTDPQGLSELMADMDAATMVIGEWLRRAGLGADERTPA